MNFSCGCSLIWSHPCLAHVDDHITIAAHAECPMEQVVSADTTGAALVERINSWAMWQREQVYGSTHVSSSGDSRKHQWKASARDMNLRELTSSGEIWRHGGLFLCHLHILHRNHLCHWTGDGGRNLNLEHHGRIALKYLYDTGGHIPNSRRMSMCAFHGGYRYGRGV